MRPGTLLVTLGVALILGGVAQAWYFATTTYPAEESQVEQNCLSHLAPAPCVSLSPASDQGPYVLGEFLVAVGVILAVFGGLRFAWATRYPTPPPRRPS